MNSINVFNKQLVELRGTFIQEFIDKLKVKLPEKVHPILDEQLNTHKEQNKDFIKNINKQNKKNHKDAPKKPTRLNGWQVFCEEKSKELTDDVPQNEKWALFSPDWAELKSNGGDKYWRDLADMRNSKVADSQPVVSTEDTTNAAPKTAVIKTEAAPKKAVIKTEAAPKKAVINKAVIKKEAVPKKAVPIIDEPEE